MSFLRYFSEFFLFRWIMGSGNRRHDSRPAPTPERHSRYDTSRPSCHDYGRQQQSFDEFHEEQDDYDMFDDDF